VSPTGCPGTYLPVVFGSDGVRFGDKCFFSARGGVTGGIVALGCDAGSTQLSRAICKPESSSRFSFKASNSYFFGSFGLSGLGGDTLGIGAVSWDTGRTVPSSRATRPSLRVGTCAIVDSYFLGGGGALGGETLGIGATVCRGGRTEPFLTVVRGGEGGGGGLFIFVSDNRLHIVDSFARCDG
jgi:hypothetical protein